VPYAWINPEVFFELNGVKIYHIYRNDQLGEGVRKYWYGWHIDCCDDSGEYSFDIREMGYKVYMDAEREDHKEILKKLIEQGYITSDGIIAKE
jgi:hypothetical protein